MLLTTVPGHTAGHVSCPVCETARRKIMPPADFALMHFNDAASAWLNEHKAEIGERTKRNYDNNLRFLGEFFGEMPLREIHIGHVQQYQEWRQRPRFDDKARRTWTAGYSPINHECSALAQILGRAGLWLDIARFYRPLKQPKTRAGVAQIG